MQCLQQFLFYFIIIYVRVLADWWWVPDGKRRLFQPSDKYAPAAGLFSPSIQCFRNIVWLLYEPFVCSHTKSNTYDGILKRIK